MLLYLGLFLTILLGFSLVNLISRQFTLIEKIGLSFLLGIALQTILMLLLDIVSIPLTATSILSIEILTLLLLNIPVITQRKEVLKELKSFPSTISFSFFNLLWVLFIVLIVYFEYMNFSKCLYFPPFDRDSLAGFETIGYVIAQEHTLKGLSLFQGDYMPSVHGAGSYITYAPMVQLSYAYVYILGAETSKIIPGLVYLFFLIAFYASARRVIKDTGAAIVTFFVLITPDMLSFSSLSMTNVIHAVFASMGIIYIALWLRNREKKDLILGAILLGANMWCRTEGIVFIGAALCVLFVDVLMRKQYKEIITPTIIMLLPALLWTVFSKINGLYAESIAITKPFWDSEKIGVIWTYMTGHYENSVIYGWTFIVFALSFLVNIWFLIKRKDNIGLLSMILLASLFYMIVIYQIEYKWDSIQNVLAYSAKRFLFCFVPILWFYVASNHSTILIINQLEKLLVMKKGK